MANLTLAGPGRYEFSHDVHVASLPWKPGMSQELSSSSSRNVSTVSRSTDKTSLFLPRISIPESNKLIVRARRNGEVVATATQSGSTRSFMFYEFSPAFPTGSVDLELIIDSGYRFDYIVSPEPMPSANANP